MVDESMSLIKYVPNFARGFNVLLIHDDKNSRSYLSWVLELYSFKVTATNNICSATSMICSEESMFKLVMTKANMPDMDALSFLDLVLEEDVPVIFTNSGVFDNATRKALGTRLCYFLQEPISPNDLKYLWQHVYQPRPYSAKNTQNADFQSMVPHAKGLENTQTKQVIEAKRGNNDADADADIRDELKGKRIVCNYTMPTTECLTDKAFGKRNHDDNLDKQEEKRNVELEKPDSLRSAKMKCNINEYSRMSQYKKRSTVWTPELHRKFLKAVEELGEDCARPKQILVRMNMNGPYYLTVRQVASHLQKYRLRLQYEEKSRNSHLSNVRTSSCSGHKAKFPRSEWSPLETKAFGPGFPAPKVFLNENRNQDQIPVNNMGMKFTDSSDSHPIPDASLDINIPDNEFYDLVRTFVEDCDCFNLYDYETNPAAVDECTKMLRKFLDGKSSS